MTLAPSPNVALGMNWSTSNLTSSQEVAVHTKQWSIDVFVSEDGDNTNARAVLPASALPGDDAALVVTADEPVIVESTIFAARDATRSAAVPSR